MAKKAKGTSGFDPSEILAKSRMKPPSKKAFRIGVESGRMATLAEVGMEIARLNGLLRTADCRVAQLEDECRENDDAMSGVLAGSKHLLEGLLAAKKIWVVVEEVKYVPRIAGERFNIEGVLSVKIGFLGISLKCPVGVAISADLIAKAAMGVFVHEHTEIRLGPVDRNKLPFPAEAIIRFGLSPQDPKAPKPLRLVLGFETLTRDALLEDLEKVVIEATAIAEAREFQPVTPPQAQRGDGGGDDWFNEVMETIVVMRPLELTGGVPTMAEPGRQKAQPTKGLRAGSDFGSRSR